MVALMAGQIALSAIGSFLSGGVAKYNARAQQAQQASQAYLQGINEIRQLSKALELQGHQNEKIMQADEYNFVNTRYMAGLAGVQDALSRKITARNQSLISRGERIDLGTASAESAAAGTIGASANAVMQNIRRNNDSIRVEVQEQRELERDSYYQEVRSLYTNYYQNQQEIDTTLPDVPDNPRLYRAPIQNAGFGAHLLGAAVDVGSSYLSNMVSLGSKPMDPRLAGRVGTGRL